MMMKLLTENLAECQPVDAKPKENPPAITEKPADAIVATSAEPVSGLLIVQLYYSVF